PEAGAAYHVAISRRSILNAPIRMVDQAGARPLHRDGHAQGCQGQVGAQMILHRPAHDPATVKIPDSACVRGENSCQPKLFLLDNHSRWLQSSWKGEEASCRYYRDDSVQLYPQRVL